MNLAEFPRPRNDNGRGVHWSMSPYWDSQGKQKWSFWAQQLEEMQIKWVKVIDDGGGSSLRLVNRLLDLGVMPVIRLYWPEQNSAKHTSGIIGSRGAQAVEQFIDLGAVYFEVNNEPDLALEWEDGKRPENWLDIVTDNFIADADIILSLGGYPAVPAFGVGSLTNIYQAIVDRGRADILHNGCWAGIHNYALGRPLEYPDDPVNLYGQQLTQEEYDKLGGFRVWEISLAEVNKARLEYANPNASILTDATCFRAFRQVNKVIVDAIGHSIPILTTEGGYNVMQRGGTFEGDDPRYAKPTPQRVSELTLKMFNYIQGTETVLDLHAPDYYFACMPWLIANYDMHVYQTPAECQGPWFTDFFDIEFNLHGELPIVQMLKNAPSVPRVCGPVPEAWETTRASDTLGKKWDNRLDYIGVTYEPGVVWKVEEAEWRDEEESNGMCAIFVRILDSDGTPIPNKEFFVSREDAIDRVSTKDAQDNFWGDYTLYGALGTYTICVTEDGPQIFTRI